MSWRLTVVVSMLTLAVFGLVSRLLYLSVFERAFLLRQSQARILRYVTIPTHRGIITDRLGSPLAVSTPVSSIWINPKTFAPNKQQAQQLEKILGISKAVLQRYKKKKTKREFVYLKRLISSLAADQVGALNISGLYFQREYRRYYPEGGVTAHIVGFTNVDDQGQEGIELALDSWLHGQPGKKQVLKDRLGNIITELQLLKEPIEGKNLQLSIDHRIQYVAYQHLKDAVELYHAKSGSAVVLDVNTGEILAMVNQPSYNPNDYRQKKANQFRNRAVTDVFEPGSVIKPFTVALALQSGRYQPDTKIDTDSGWMRIGGYRIRDDLNYGVVTVTELLEKSSNIAAAKILLSLQPKEYWQLLSSLGFGRKTQSGFPGEAEGRISPQDTWVPSVIATLAYGYGLSVTPLQLAQAYAVIASGGLKRPVTFLKIAQPAVGEQIIPHHVAEEVATMLQAVVDSGTGTRARVPGYAVAGKTGTSYIAEARGYDHRRYMSSFAGFAPAKNPKVVVVVVIQEPQGQHFGSIVAAPVFSKIMSATLRILDIPPVAIHRALL